MSFLPDNETPQQNSAGPAWDPTGELTAVPDMEDSRINRASFYQDVFRPAWKSLEDAAATLLLEWFSGTLNTVGKLVNWYNVRQAEKEQHFQQQNAWKRRYKPETPPIPLEAPIGLRKVLGENSRGPSATNITPIAESLQSENLLPEPLEGTAGQTGIPQESPTAQQAAAKTTQPVKSLPRNNPWLDATRKQQCVLEIQPPQAKKPARQFGKPSKKKFEDEPIRGLDDIYTSPVNGFFSEEKDFTFKKPEPKKQAPSGKKAGLSGLNPRTIAELIDEELERTLTSGRTSNPVASKPKYETTTTTQRELHDYELIPGLSPSPATTDAASVLQAELEQCASDYPQQESGSSVTATKPQSGHGASVLLAKARSANLEFKRKMPTYQEMKHELSGADLMARNNRILHNSINNLTDAYFKRAAQEEQQEYY